MGVFTEMGNKLAGMFGMNGEEDHTTHSAEDENTNNTSEGAEASYTTRGVNMNNTSSTDNSAMGDNNLFKNIVILKPKTLDEGKAIVDFLKRKSTVVVNTDDLSPDVSHRLQDFLVGAVYYTNAKLIHIKKTVLLITPNGVDVVNTVNDSQNGPDSMY